MTPECLVEKSASVVQKLLVLGVWTFDANARGELEPGDLEEAVAAVLSVGDPADTWFDPTQHGTDLQRTAAFAIGFEGGAADCTDQAFFDLFPGPAEWPR